MSTKITSTNGTTIIMSREEASSYEGSYKVNSSTEGQPYVAMNFKDGKMVGGSTITEGYKCKIIAKAHEMGWIIE
jgi:hypothetical protein